MFTRENLGSIPRLNQIYFDLPLSDCVIDGEEVLKELEKLDVSKSPGPDGIHNKVLFELRSVLYVPLTHLFNISLKSGSVPSGWKRAHVTPLFKKGNKNWRKIIDP